MDDYIRRKSVTVGLDYIINELNKLITDDSSNDGYTDIKSQVEEIKRGVLKLPSADVQPVMHGEWYKPTGMMPPEYTGRHRCSLCDGFAMHEWKHHREVLTDYCPNCGAKMDRKGADNEND